MPLETRDRDPDWAKGCRTSTETTHQQRQDLRARGLEVFDRATRLGQNLKARTENELIELGRRGIEEGQAAAGQRRAIGEAVLGTGNNPTTVRVVGEWAAGTGPVARDLSAGSRFSNGFASSPNVKSHLRKATEAWNARDGGAAKDGSEYTEYKGDFGPIQYAQALISPAGSAIGSARFDGRRRGNQMEWTASNDMGLHSFFYGNFLDSRGLPSVPNRSRPGPFGTTTQRIGMRTDLNGNPIR